MLTVFLWGLNFHQPRPVTQMAGSDLGHGAAACGKWGWLKPLRTARSTCGDGQWLSGIQLPQPDGDRGILFFREPFDWPDCVT
jgi:hypothetical protein